MTLPRSLPNQITIARLVLAAALFVLLHLVGWAQGRAAVAPGEVATWETDLTSWVQGRESLLLNLGAVIFVLAAISDILDGQIARRWNLTTDFGRIADPFADKVVVIGAFLFLIPIAGSGVAAWMVVLIVARESFVDGIRGFAESHGLPFPASFWGKAKMVTQSACVITILIVLANLRGRPFFEGLRQLMIGAALVATGVSGFVYLLRARKILALAAGGERIEASPAPAAPARVEVGP